jgi:glycosyltransferase involved in cell wall biosynthesis
LSCRNLHILLVSPFHYTDTGGVCTTIRMLYQEFSKAGIRVSVLVPGEGNRVSPLRNPPDIALYGIYLRGPFRKESPLRGIIAFWVYLPYTLYALRKFIKRNQISCVLVQYPRAYMFYFGIIRLLCSCKLVVTLQGNDVHDLSTERWIDRLFVRFLLLQANVVVAVAASLLKELNTSFPDLRTVKVVIPNGAPVELFSHWKDSEGEWTFPRDYILTVGQLIHRKGFDILIRALRGAHDRGCPMDLVIVGEGPERASLSQLAAELGLIKNVHFVGNQPHEKILGFFNHCLFFVLASRAEGLPLVIAEAMASSKAVIATAVDGVPEIIEDEATGLLVQVEDRECLTDALVRLFQDCDFRARLARQGREKVLHDYAWEAIARRYLDILR